MGIHHTTTHSPRAALLLGLLSFGISAATTAQAGNQLFEGSWSVKSFGNECRDATDPTPGPYCGNGAPESEFYSAFGIPQGIQCNPNQPRCPFESTPTNGTGMFAPSGGTQAGISPFCAPWFDWQGNGTTARPAKDETAHYTGKVRKRIPPLYRNPAFFTSGGQPHTTSCTAASTGATPGGRGRVQAGIPVAGRWTATTTGTQKGGFRFNAAPEDHAFGVRTTGQIGEFAVIFPYVYSYTYGTLRNDVGLFGPGKGPGSFNLVYNNIRHPNTPGTKSVARINVKQGAARFGGTMKMLGALRTKVCYYRSGGCSLGENYWRYDAVGAAAYTYEGIVTQGHVVTTHAYYYNTGWGYSSSTIRVTGFRFPWTTGSVTVTATGRGPHKTIHYAHGFDNRNTTTPSGTGTIQLVSPILTRWRQPAVNFETAGIGIMRIKFIPEPQAWVMFVAGASLLWVGARITKR